MHIESQQIQYKIIFNALNFRTKRQCLDILQIPIKIINQPIIESGYL